MLKQRIVKWCCTAMIGAMAYPAFGWGPETKESVVASAGHVFTRNSSIPLTNLMKYVYQGVRLSEEEEVALYLQFEVDPVRTIQREMFLLQGIKSDRVDPYFVYRLGALGKKIAELASPLRGENAQIREQYYADVDALIHKVRLQSSTPNIVEPQLYFARLQSQVRENDRAILMDYRAGFGIEGIGGKVLARDASRAVDAIADVWFTIFRSQVEFVDISKSDMRDYMLKAIDFYLKNENIAEVNDVYRRAKQKYILTPEMNHTIGDLYYDNGYFEEALVVYDELLAEEPGLRGVNERIAAYYVSIGDQALDDKNLEDAREAFELAVNADVLHPEAQRRLVSTNRAIQQRQDRYSGFQDSIELAERAQLEAEDTEQRRLYAQSIQYLRTAEKNYAQVTDEFPELYRQATRQLRGVRIRLNEMKKAMVANAQLLSGSGFAYDAKQLVGDVGDTSRDAMTSVLKADYKAALEDLALELELP